MKLADGSKDTHLLIHYVNMPSWECVGVSRFLVCMVTVTMFVGLIVSGCGNDPVSPSVVVPRVTDFNPSWGVDDVILFDHVPLDSLGEYDYTRVGIYRVNADGTAFGAFMLRRDYGGHYGLQVPRWSPDGDWVALENPADGQIYKISYSTLEVVKLTDEPYRYYAPTWRYDGKVILCIRWLTYPIEERGIYVVDSAGGPTRLLKQIDGLAPSWSSQANEIALVTSIENLGFRQLSVIDTLLADLRTLLRWDVRIMGPKFSPDGSRILFYTLHDYGTDSHIWIVDRDGENVRALVTDGGAEPSWSPDGKRIVYVKNTTFGHDRAGSGKLWIMNADGTGRRQLTF